MLRSFLLGRCWVEAFRLSDVMRLACNGRFRARLGFREKSRALNRNQKT